MGELKSPMIRCRSLVSKLTEHLFWKPWTNIFQFKHWIMGNFQTVNKNKQKRPGSAPVQTVDPGVSVSGFWLSRLGGGAGGDGGGESWLITRSSQSIPSHTGLEVDYLWLSQGYLCQVECCTWINQDVTVCPTVPVTVTAPVMSEFFFSYRWKVQKFPLRRSSKWTR